MKAKKKHKKLGKRGAVGAPASNKEVKKYGEMATGKPDGHSSSSSQGKI